MIIRWILILFMLAPSAFAQTFSKRAEVVTFVDELCKEYDLDKQKTMQALSTIEPSDEVIKRITTPFESVKWSRYKKLFLSDKKITGGVVFWNKHKETLDRAEKEYGVPPEIIVAIIGVESAYGQNSGKFPVLQALATLAFDYPPRAKFFKSELKQYLLMTQEQKIDPLTLKGSYAGAMGFPQFISSSYRNYAVDFDNSGSIDIVNNMQQAIGSVGNYFRVHGWETGKPVAHQLENPEQLKGSDKRSKLLAFDLENGKEYWEGLNNFYVITRYNHSDNYALAVYQLSQAIAKLYNNS